MRGPTAPGRPIVAMCTSRTAGTAASALKKGCGGGAQSRVTLDLGHSDAFTDKIAFAHPQIPP